MSEHDAHMKRSASVMKVDVGTLKMDTIVFTGALAAVQVAFFVYAAVAKMDYGKDDFEASFYTMFIHVSIMIFFGFGFLMTFLRRSGYTAVGMCMICSVVATQLSLVMSGVFKEWAFSWGGNLDIHAILNGLFCSGAVMISMGAVLGKVSPGQLLVMAIIETVLYWINLGIYFKDLEGYDAAGGVTLHTFGAYFGLAVAKVLTRPENLHHEENSSIYSSDLFSLAGTLFLWLLWPSFCAAVAGDKFIAVTNTYLALIGSTIGFAICSRVLHEFKLDVVELQNATLAGGVVVGVWADYRMGPAGTMALGLLAGMVSTIGYAKVNLGRIGLSDTCGVNNLHGMPGLISGIVGIGAYVAKDQALGLVITLAIAICGGTLTGFILRVLPGGAKTVEEFFNDAAYFGVPEDYTINPNKGIDGLGQA